MKRRLLILPIGLLLAQLGFAQGSTFDLIQERIFTPQCAGCHSEGTSFALQSGLLLPDADASYANLAGVTPHNTQAALDHLQRVSTEGGPGAPEQSFLWHKINAPELEHLHEHHPYYGEIMPLGMPFLTNGELDFVRQWIVSGAPRTGSVADTAAFEDTSRYQRPPFAPLDPPDFGEQYHLGPFTVNSGPDRELFYYEPRTGTPERLVNRFQIVMAPGSHHFILYTYPPGTPGLIIPQAHVIRDIRDEDGNYIFQNMIPMAYQQFFAGTQYPFLDYHFPPGVALRLLGNRGIDLNSHYVNQSGSPISGEIYANLYFVEPTEIEHVAEILELNNQNITLPPSQVTTITRDYTFGDERTVFQLVSHAHQHMTEFRVELLNGPRDGELVYVTHDWQHPPILQLDPPLVFEPGQGFHLAVTYDNWTNQIINFGLTAEDEMMILFGYWYPGAEAADPMPPTGTTFELLPNFPNPFNNSTEIRYALSSPAHVRLAIYNLQGELVTTLLDAPASAGTHALTWSAGDMASGVYLCRLEAGTFSATQKLVLLK